MQPEDFVYDQVLKGALSKGAKNSQATGSAIAAVEAFKKGRTNGKKVSHLIEDHIKQAVRNSKK